MTTHDQQSALTLDVRSYFERAAGSFDRLYSEEDQSAFMRWLNRQFRSDIVGRFVLTCEHVKRARATSVLDVGCGSGRYLAEFARMGVDRLVGIDLSGPMLDLARAQLKAVGHPRMEFVHCDFATFNASEQFDVVVAMGLFDYLESPVATLTKMRALSRHSVIASFPSRHWFRTPLRRLRYKLKNCPVFFFDSEKINALAGETGFASVETRKLPGAGMDYVSVLHTQPNSR